MKHILRSMILILFYFLAVCALCSAKIEELMTADVFTTSSELQVEAAYSDEDGYHLFQTVDGGYWKNGMYAEELAPYSYHMSTRTVGDREILSQIMVSGYHIQCVEYSTRPLGDGARVNILTKQEIGPDEYLMKFPPGEIDFDELRPRLIVEDRKDTMWLVSAPDATQPFMENQIRRQLSRFDQRAMYESTAPLDTYFRSASSLDIDIYSIPAIEQFVENIPILSVLLLLVLFPVLLWFSFCVLFSRWEKPRYITVVNFALVGADLAAMSYVLTRIELPPSLLPAKHIFEWNHYAAEFAEISDLIAHFNEHGSIQELSQHMAHTSQVTPVILLAGGLLMAAVIAIEIFVMRKSAARIDKISPRM